MSQSELVINLLKQHRSIRKFQPVALSDEQLETIVSAAQAASTSSNVQAYSVIAVRDPDKRKQLAHLTGDQEYVEKCGMFLVWCADLYRNKHAVESVQGGLMEVDLLEPFVVATIDVALAAQNAMVAAEAMGLGGVFIGGIRNQPAEVTALLELPKLVYPAFGMCLGVPAQSPGIRPRLPVSGVLHRDRYETENIQEGIRLYDEIMEDYYRKRGRETVTNWSHEQKSRFSQRIRAGLKGYLEQQGFHFK